MDRRITLALCVATLVIGSACGLVGGAGGPSPTPSVRDRAVAAWTQAIQCARDHGWNVPDPAIDDAGNATFPSDVGKPPQQVLDACQHYLDGLPNPNPGAGDGPTADDIRMGRQFADCMRQHGEPRWPDPNADGTFPLTPDIESEGKSPAFIGALQQCGQFHPSGSIHFSPVTGG